MRALFYVIGEHLASAGGSGGCWLLTNEGESEAKARRSISWQNQPRPDFSTRWHICRYNPAAGAFVSLCYYDPNARIYPHGAGQELRPDAGPYTPEAWARILADIVEAHA